jgi:hypothetical protein
MAVRIGQPMTVAFAIAAKSGWILSNVCVIKQLCLESGCVLSVGLGRQIIQSAKERNQDDSIQQPPTKCQGISSAFSHGNATTPATPEPKN